MRLKEGQWYQLPSGQWTQAVCVDDPLGPILHVFGIDLAGTDGYKIISAIYVWGDRYTLGVTGLCTWDRWTLADLYEATPDEAEAQIRRVLGMRQ